ncbi:hypothetical protein [Cypionkella sinensis]|uniref:Uncharacterized protein n=1 Tax=Cypionkella sinensis TaxID=1756043 RepID=A0ABV7J1W5_9RHOB
MLRILFALTCLALPAHAENDVFEQLSGVYGDPDGFVETCKGAPQHVIFSKDRKRGAVQVFSDLNGTTDMLLAIDLPFAVLGRTAQGILIQFDSEDMRDPTGALRTWEFRPLTNPDRYCWHATGSPEPECINTVRLCDSDVPMS